MKVSKCVGCGFCCIKARCAASLRLYPVAEICPALIWSEKEKRHYCDLMLLPGKLGELYRKELFAGEGCCCNLNTWRKEKIIDRTKRNIINNNVTIPKVMQHFLVSLGKQFISGDTIYLVICDFVNTLCEKNVLSENEAKILGNKCIALLKESRKSDIESFMG